MLSFYLLLNIAIILFPLLFTFDKRIGYYRKLPAVLAATLVVGTIFVLWDALATLRGDWAFNESYVMDFRLLGLPIEELLFFVTVPYSCIFIYESVLYFFKDGEVVLGKRPVLVASLLVMAGAVLLAGRYYTSTALFAASLTLIILAFSGSRLLSSRAYWQYLGLSFVMFLIFNYILTSMPVVVYNPESVLGWRVTTIPVEDFLFNFSMLSLYLLVYVNVKKNAGRRIYSPPFTAPFGPPFGKRRI